MAHMIDFSNNRANIAYVGKTPWHGLGVNLEEGQSLDKWRVAAGMNWEALRSKEMFYDQDGNLITGNDDILFRSDTKAKLGNCTERYRIIQPADVLEFYRDLVATQGWSLDVAGCLDGGKRLWALAKTEQEFAVKGTIDRVGAYLLLATSYDGTMATVGKFTSVRVVCQNTLSMSLGDKLAKVSVRHNTEFNAESVKQELGVVETSLKQLEMEANILADRKMSDSEAMRFIKDVIAGKDIKDEDVSTRAANIIKGVFSLYKGAGMGATLNSAQGTAWGVLNAITEHVDHHTGRNANNRVRNAWFGQGENVKLEAKSSLLKMAA